MKLVSIIVPVYNVELFLKKCVNSILNQTFSNIEVILVDDGSTDSSKNICKQFQQIDSRIRVITKINGGLSDARNAGLDVATGDYIIFVDSDDYVNENFVMKLVKSLEKNSAEIAICGFNVVKATNNYEETLDSTAGVFSGRELLSKIMGVRGYRYVVAWNKIYKRSLFQYIRFDKGKVFEDEYICSRLLFNVSRVCVVNQPLYNYVQRESSITKSDLSWEKINMKKEMYIQRIDFFKEHQDEMLVRKAEVTFSNWIIEILGRKQIKKVVPKDELKSIKQIFRKMDINILINSNVSLLVRGQEFVGMFNVPMAAKIKHVLLSIKRG